MRAIFRYPGSKWSIADWIICHFPEGYEKMVYLEPFVGSGAVFFNKRPGAVETINDLDGDVVNLFRVIRDQPNDLMRVLECTPYSREEYYLSFEPCADPVEKARRYIVKTTQAIGAKMAGSSKCGWRNHKQIKIGGTACKWNGIINTLDFATARLRGDTTHLVQVENTNALQLIARYNHHDVLMYLDPPYLLSVRRGTLYKHEMDTESHRELLEIIRNSKAKIIISGYENDLYNTTLTGWYKDCTASQTTSGKKAMETIWMNYDPPMRQYSLWEDFNFELY